METVSLILGACSWLPGVLLTFVRARKLLAFPTSCEHHANRTCTRTQQWQGASRALAVLEQQQGQALERLRLGDDSSGSFCEKNIWREGGKPSRSLPNTLTRTHYICATNTCRFVAMSHLPRRLCLPARTRPTRASCPLYPDASARGARPATWKHGGERVGYRCCAGSTGWAWGDGQPCAQMRSPILCAMYPRVDGCPAYLSRVSRGACLWHFSYMLVSGYG